MPADRRAAAPAQRGRAGHDVGHRAAAAASALPAAILDALPLPVAVVRADGGIVAANRAMQARVPAGAGRAGASFAERFPEYAAALGGDPTGAREVAVPGRSERLAVSPLDGGAAIAVLDAAPGADPQTTRLASLGFMVAGVCHEVSNPLAAIHSMVQILQSKRGASPEIFERGLASIAANIDRVLAITRTLTRFSRTGDEPARPVELAQVVADAASLVRHQAGPSALAIESAVTGDARVLARPGQLEQVVFNILLNAAQAMGGCGRVTVAAERRGARVALVIRDEGPGIAPEHLGRIFEPFFTTREGTGTGLGLAISSGIVQELGGDLRAENHPGGGASFRLELPAHAP